jgi:hypothetical protein
LVASLAVAAASQAQPQAQAPAPAEPQLPPQYEVEILIFANRDFDPTEERFDQTLNGFDGDAVELREVPIFADVNPDPLAPPANALPPAAPLGSPVDPLQPADPLAAQRAEALRIRPLRPEQLKLGNEYRKLEGLRAYLPLVHAGWVQPGLPEADAQPFDLKSIGVVNPSGTIRVHLSRFLHITLDVAYRADGATTAGLASNDGLDELVLAPRYKITATRSARSNELHYFDHPAFGVLVRITPVPAQNTTTGRLPAA